MAIFAIGDMHLSLGTDKPMDVFPGWEGYLPRLEASWRKLIGPDDTVVLAGVPALLKRNAFTANTR